MSELFRFRNFPVYRDARALRLKIREVSKYFPKEEKYVLTSQLNRAMDSVLLNIAEGSYKYSDLDFSRYLNISVGSLCEVVACLDLAIDSQFINSQQHTILLTDIDKILRQLKAFTARVRRSK